MPPIAYTFLFAALLILVFGPGLFSLDALIARRFRPYMHTRRAKHTGKRMQSLDNERNEAAMIAEVLAGQTEAFHELIRPYERSVYLMALSLLHNEAEAEDAAQEAFIKAYRNLGRFRSESRFSTWLIAIALNEARARLRRKQPGLTDSIDDTRRSRRPGPAHRLARDSLRDPRAPGSSFPHSPRPLRSSARLSRGLRPPRA